MLAVAGAALGVNPFSSDETKASKYIEEITYGKNAGKSNLGEKKEAGLNGLVLFYDSNNMHDNGQRNETTVFEKLVFPERQEGT